MHITELSLDTQNIREQYHFYTTILGLPLKEKTPATFTVQAGTTSLTFRETTKETGYHVAFTIPSNLGFPVSVKPKRPRSRRENRTAH